MLGRNEEFARRIEKVRLRVAEWERQQDALRTARAGFDLGFAFFYLNRTNRSRIMNGGVIGGRDQGGEWRIDARFNRADLAARVRALCAFRRQITVTRPDALEFLRALPSEGTMVLTYLDPPYYAKGRALYTNFYNAADHRAIARFLRSYRQPWLLTYDACDEVRALYKTRVVLDSELSYSAREVRRGQEIVVLGPGVRQPAAPPTRPKSRKRAGFELLLSQAHASR